MAEQRIAKITRNTKETQIQMELNVDGTGVSEIETWHSVF
jgi:imidazoleglycerol phosphate dehydratase HisB